jgi:hypothetical protein
MHLERLAMDAPMPAHRKETASEGIEISGARSIP